MDELDVVTLIKPFENLEVGLEGTILIKYNDNDFEVEFVNENGEFAGLVTIPRDYLKLKIQYSK